ncbi:Uncharacterised protein [Acinetobacter baumannii]|nr:Uncharacterised protein [Acinetobacter baumannii]SSS19718.1 Uncharacterised protein [Acinetobacter baumannii]
MIGTTRLPTMSMNAIKPITFNRVIPSVNQMLPSAPAGALPPSKTAVAGRSTKTSTITKSSTNSQPTAILPFTESKRPRSPKAFNKTTVLAHDRLKPKTRAEPKLQPHNIETPIPSKVATAICKIAPGKAIRRTCKRSFNEKCIPTPNIKNITPSSASWLAR